MASITAEFIGWLHFGQMGGSDIFMFLALPVGDSIEAALHRIEVTGRKNEKEQLPLGQL